MSAARPLTDARRNWVIPLIAVAAAAVAVSAGILLYPAFVGARTAAIRSADK